MQESVTGVARGYIIVICRFWQSRIPRPLLDEKGKEGPKREEGIFFRNRPPHGDTLLLLWKAVASDWKGVIAKIQD